MVGMVGQSHISYPHLHAMNSDIVGLVTLKCLSLPAGSSKRGCYGKSTSCASEKTEILKLASLHMIPCVVIGSAGSSGPAFKVCQITSLACQNLICLIGHRGSAAASSLTGNIKLKCDRSHHVQIFEDIYSVTCIIAS